MFQIENLKSSLTEWRNWALLALISLAVLQLTHPKKIVTVKTVTKVETKVVEKVLFKDRLKVVNRTVKKPDGTVIITESHEEVKLNETTDIHSDKKQEQVTSKTVDPIQSKYLLGLGFVPTKVLPSSSDLEIEGAVRAGGTPIWVYGRATAKKTFSLGILLEL